MSSINKACDFFIRLQKSNNVYNPSTIKRLVTTEYFFEKLQQSYNLYDSDLVCGLLSDNFVYESFFDFNHIKSKGEYLDYLSRNLMLMKKSGHKEKMELLYNSDTGEQVLIFNNKPIPKQSGEYVCLVATANNLGTIDKLSLTLTSFYDNLFLPKDCIEDLENIEVSIDDILPSFLD